MDKTTIQQLLAINRQFYQTFAAEFSATRRRLQPGVLCLLPVLPNLGRFLDLGCGNGELYAQLARRGQRGQYTGLDNSPTLVAQARAHATSPSPDFPAAFHLADLASPGWEQYLKGSAFDIVFAFAVLHHLPGDDLRRQLLDQVHALLAPGGLFMHSEWQPLNSPRLRLRLQPWDAVGLSPSDLDPGDYLLDWRSGGKGLRYVHQFNEDELAALRQASGFSEQETFASDGESGRLSLYQVWRRDG